jgi:hypothetical protein
MPVFLSAQLCRSSRRLATDSSVTVKTGFCSRSPALANITIRSSDTSDLLERRVNRQAA